MAYDIGPLDGGGGGGRGARRLLALADYLQRVPGARYDHRAWRRRTPGGGWAMCALGHAVDGLPDLIGLRWRAPETSDDVVRLDGSGMTEDPLVLAAEAFELTEDEARMIFGVGLYTVGFYGPAAVFRASPQEVACAIRAFAAAKLARCGMVALAG
jgi:hypothetical protein